MSFVPIVLQNQLPFRLQKIQFSGISAHWHDSLEILCVTESAVNVLSENQSYHLQKNDLFINNPMCVHEVTSLSSESKLIAIQIPFMSLSKEFARFCPGIESMRFALTPEDSNKASYHIISQMISKMYNSHLNWKENQMELCGDLYNILHILHSEYLDGTAAKVHQTVENEAFVQILHYLQLHYKEKISREKLGKLFGYSPVYISQLFQKNAGQTLINHINQLRLSSAYKDLIYTDKSITYISEDNGFSSQKYFNKCFQKEYGMTPKLFRHQYKELHDGLGLEGLRDFSEQGSQKEYDVVYDPNYLSRYESDQNPEGDVIYHNIRVQVSDELQKPCQLETILFCDILQGLSEDMLRGSIRKSIEDSCYQYAFLSIDSSSIKNPSSLIDFLVFLISCNLTPLLCFHLKDTSTKIQQMVIDMINTLYEHFPIEISTHWNWGIRLEVIPDKLELTSFFHTLSSKTGIKFGIVYTPDQGSWRKPISHLFSLNLCLVPSEKSIDLATIGKTTHVILLQNSHRNETNAIEETKRIFQEIRKVISIVESVSIQQTFSESFKDSPLQYLKKNLASLNNALFASDGGCIVAKKNATYNIILGLDSNVFYPNITVHLQILGIIPGKYYISISTLNNYYGNPMAMWKTLDSPTYMNSSLLETLYQASAPKKLLLHKELDSNKEFSFSIPDNSLHIIQLTPLL